MNVRSKPEIQFLLEITKPYRWATTQFFFGSAVSALFDGISIGLLIPLIQQLQNGQAAKDFGAFGWATQILATYSLEKQIMGSITLVIVAVLIKNLIFAFSLTKGIWLSNQITTDLRLRAVNLLLKVGLEFHHRSEVGTLLEKATNYTQNIKDLLFHLSQFFVFLSIVIILVVLMLVISWPLTLFAVGIGGLGIGVMYLYLKKMSHYGEQTALASSEMTQSVVENLSAVKLIQSFAKEPQQYSQMRKTILNYQTADNRLAYRSNLIQPMTEGLGVISMGALLAGALFLAPAGNTLLLAQLLPFLYILLRVITTLKILYSAQGIVRARWPFLRLVRDLVRTDDKPFPTDGNNVFKGFSNQIVLDNVTFAYDKDKSVLKNLSFSIPHGKTTAIIGKSGVGKSTVVDLLLRFYDPQEGAIYIDDNSLNDFQLDSYRRNVGVVSQETFLFNSSVRDNIAFGMDEAISESQIVEAAQKAGAHEFICNLANGYDTILGDRGVKLSGGQRQRIAIARAIIKEPSILILDEATSSLDLVTEQKIRQTISSLSRGRTIIIIAHRTSAIANADQIVVLKDGRVAEVGDAQTLTKQAGEYHLLTLIEQPVK